MKIHEIQILIILTNQLVLGLESKR